MMEIGGFFMPAIRKTTDFCFSLWNRKSDIEKFNMKVL